MRAAHPRPDFREKNWSESTRRAWAREVNSFTDSELILCVRAQVAVDTAVNTYRKSAAAPFSFDVPT